MESRKMGETSPFIPVLSAIIRAPDFLDVIRNKTVKWLNRRCGRRML
jgi:hypothetical protein